MILKWYIDKVADRLQITDATEKLVLKDYVNQAIEKMFYLYPELLYAETTVDTVADADTVDLPTSFWKPVALTIEDIKMVKIDRWKFSQIIPNQEDDQNAQPFYYDIVGVNTSTKTIASALELISTSASDITQTLTIYGEDADGLLVSQAVTVTGLTAAVFTVEFAKIYYAVLSDVCIGRIDIRLTAASVVQSRIYPGALDVDFIEVGDVLRLYPTPDAVYSIRLKYFQTIPELQSDGDYLKYLRPTFYQDIVDRAYIQFLYFDGQPELAGSLELKWKNDMEEKIDEDKRRSRQDYPANFGMEIGVIRSQFDPLNRWH